MAAIQIDLRDTGYETLALALTGAQNGSTSPTTPLFYDDAGAFGPGTSVFSDNTMLAAFSTTSTTQFWIDDVNKRIIQINNGSVNNTDPFINWDCSMLTVNDGATGTSISSSWTPGQTGSNIVVRENNGTGTITTVYVDGITDYHFSFTIPTVGFLNSGNAQECIITGVNVTTTLAPVPNYYEFEHQGNAVQAYTEGATLLFPTFTLKVPTYQMVQQLDIQYPDMPPGVVLMLPIFH